VQPQLGAQLLQEEQEHPSLSHSRPEVNMESSMFLLQLHPVQVVPQVHLSFPQPDIFLD
jgi:hypothetical protein